MSTRRSFLSGLARLPLIGGSVTLIGAPTAADVPLSRDLLDSYEAWLDFEQTYLRWERYGPQLNEEPALQSLEVVWRDRRNGRTWERVPAFNAGARWHNEKPKPSTRAAVVLSAVGCDWQDT